MLTVPSERPTTPLPAQEGSGIQDFSAFLRTIRAAIDQRLIASFQEREAKAFSLGVDVQAMFEASRDLTLRGGKRLRPALLVAAYRACGGSPDERAPLDAGAALELLQTYMLIHDDWMDRDDLRRGGPSVHALLVKHHGHVALGEASAILAGDYTSAMAQETMARMPTTPANVVKAMVCFAQIQQDVVFGQQLDVAGKSENVEAMHALKTGSYTVRGPLMLGAILADASADRLVALERFGAPLGVAFQLRDDLLGVFGSPEETGKPSGSDLRAGKRTAVIAESARRLEPAGRARLDAVFGRADASDESVALAIDALERCGARAAVETRLTQLVDEAMVHLSQASLVPAGVALLHGAVRAISVRQS